MCETVCFCVYDIISRYMELWVFVYVTLCGTVSFCVCDIISRCMKLSFCVCDIISRCVELWVFVYVTLSAGVWNCEILCMWHYQQVCGTVRFCVCDIICWELWWQVVGAAMDLFADTYVEICFVVDIAVRSFHSIWLNNRVSPPMKNASARWWVFGHLIRPLCCY